MPKIQYPLFKQRNKLSGLTGDEVIYKFFPVKYLQSFVNGTLRLDHVTSWEDVYEMAFLRQQFQLSDKTPVGIENVTDGFFGQSWTLCPESDALWRIYSEVDSTGKPGAGVAVRLRTTVRRLYDALYTSDSCMANTWIGRVQYLPQADIDARIAQIAANPIDANSDFLDLVLESALTKRTEFAHEQEVRPIFWGDWEYIQNQRFNVVPVNTEIYAPFKVDFHSLIDEVTIDPRLNVPESAAMRGRLLAMGIKSSLIDKSRLYHLPPPLTITFK